MNQDVEQPSDLSASSVSIMSNFVRKEETSQLCEFLKQEIKTDNTKDSKASETKKRYESGIQAAIASRDSAETFLSVNDDTD